MRAIDVHVHVMPWEMIRPENLAIMGRTLGPERFAEVRALTTDPDAFVRYLDRCDVEWAGLINYPAPEVMGFDEGANQFSARFASTHPDRLVPFGCPDPWNSQDMAGRMDHLVEMGIRGIKIHPVHMLLYPNGYREDARLQGLGLIYAKAEEHGLPVMIHTGTSIFPRARNKFADPIHVDDLVVDFPRLKIIVAHGGRPLWMDTVFFLLRRSRNVFLDISSIPPSNLLRYFPRLEQVADQTLFGSDWPGPGVRDIADNITAFSALPLTAAAKQAILHDTAARVFGEQR